MLCAGASPTSAIARSDPPKRTAPAWLIAATATRQPIGFVHPVTTTPDHAACFQGMPGSFHQRSGQRAANPESENSTVSKPSRSPVKPPTKETHEKNSLARHCRPCVIRSIRRLIRRALRYLPSSSCQSDSVPGSVVPGMILRDHGEHLEGVNSPTYILRTRQQSIATLTVAPRQIEKCQTRPPCLPAWCRGAEGQASEGAQMSQWFPVQAGSQEQPRSSFQESNRHSRIHKGVSGGFPLEERHLLTGLGRTIPQHQDSSTVQQHRRPLPPAAFSGAFRTESFARPGQCPAPMDLADLNRCSREPRQNAVQSPVRRPRGECAMLIYFVL